MKIDKQYNLSAKRKDKWWTFGTLAENKWGNNQASFKVTKELLEFVNSHKEGEWLNFAVFEPREYRNGAEGHYKTSSEKKAEDESETPF